MGLIAFVRNAFKKSKTTLYGNTGVSNRILKKIDKIAKGQTFVRPPMHKSDEKYYADLMRDPEIRKKIDEKYEILDANLRLIEVKATPPSKLLVDEAAKRVKNLPTRQSEWEHRLDLPWEYGFYEPLTTDIPAQKLTFRESLDIMTAHVEVKNQGKGMNEAQKILNDHVVIKRVDPDKIAKMLQYFLPFETYKERAIVPKSVVEDAEKVMIRRREDQKFLANRANLPKFNDDTHILSRMSQNEWTGDSGVEKYNQENNKTNSNNNNNEITDAEEERPKRLDYGAPDNSFTVGRIVEDFESKISSKKSDYDNISSEEMDAIQRQIDASIAREREFKKKKAVT